MSSTPSAQLLPALAGDQAVIVVSLAPDVISLDVGLVALGVGAPFADLRRDGFLAELGEVGLNGLISR